MTGIKRNLRKAVLVLAVVMTLATAGYRLYHVCSTYTLDELIAHQRHH